MIPFLYYSVFVSLVSCIAVAVEKGEPTHSESTPEARESASLNEAPSESSNEIGTEPITQDKASETPPELDIEANAAPAVQDKVPDSQSPQEVTQKTQGVAKKKRTAIIDARRLEGEFNETILYIKGHPDARFKLDNVTINFGDALTQLNSLQAAQVLSRFDKINFVMTDKDHMTLDETVFIKTILPLLGHIHELELNCWGVSDKVVAAISEKMPYLTSLFLFGPGITDTTMDVLAVKLPSLKKLHLVNTSLTEKGVAKIADTFKDLYTLGVSGPNLDDDDLVVLSQGMKKLHTLSVAGQTFKDMKKVEEVIQAASSIKSLDLSETNITDDVVKSIADTMKNLEHLNISDTPVTKDGIKEIAENLNLKTLKMDDLKNIGDEELKHIAEHLQNLEKFHFSGTDFSNFGIMDIIQNLSDLEDVMLVPNHDSKWILTDAVAAALAHNLKNLQYLRIEASRLPDELRKYLSQNMLNMYIEYE